MRQFYLSVLLTSLLSIGCTDIHAQKTGKSSADALVKELGKAKEDTNKVNLLYSISTAYAANNPDKAIKYGQQGLELAERLGWKKGITKACNMLGTCSIVKHEYPKSTQYFLKCLRTAEEQQDKQAQATSLKNLGFIYTNKTRDYAKALDYCLRCMKINEGLGDKRELGDNLTAIGNIYAAMGDNTKALDNYQQALKIAEERNDKRAISENTGNISNTYSGAGDYTKALEYGQRSLKTADESGDKSSAANSLLKLGNIYYKQKDKNKALDYWQRSLKLCTETGDKDGIALTAQNIGDIYTDQNDAGKALGYYYQALRAGENTGNKNITGAALASLGSIYQAIAAGTSKGTIPDSIATMPKEQRLRRANALLAKAIEQQKETGNTDLLESTYLHLSQVQLLQGDSVAAKESFKKHNAYVEGMYNQEKNSTVAKKDLQEVFEKKQEEGAQKELSLQKELQLNSLKYEYEKKQAAAKTEEERMQLRFEEELKQKEIAFEYNQKQMQLEAKIALAKLEQEKKDEQVLSAKKERNYSIAGLGMLALFTAGVYNRVTVLRKNKRTLEEKNKLIAAEKENADRLRIRAENSERFKQQFLANMSHEIRTPMNAVSGMTELLLEKAPRADQLSYLQAISKSSDILLHIINDILDLSKIEAGKMELESIDFSISETLKQVHDTLSHKADEKGLQLMIRIDDDVADVLVGDPYRLNQVLINIGGNAIKFTERGGVHFEIKHVKRENDEISLRFSVTDTGIGIPEDKINTLFESFTQVNSSDTRKYGGTGLGLSISKQLVELQKGAINVESKHGSGTIFHFTLAYKIGSAEKLMERALREKKADGAILKGLSILVADDNEYNRLVVSETLQLKTGITPDLAINGDEAVKMLQQNNYDVILMDVQMPVMNGIEATEYIRTKLTGAKSKTPIIALTASILRADIDKCLQAGMDSYVPKPFKAWQLIATIAQVTGRKHEDEPGYTLPPNAIPASEFFTETETVTNPAYLRSFCEGDEARMKKYIRMYLQGVTVFREKVVAASNAKDLKELALRIHGFKPNWLIMGMKATGELGNKIELLCKENDDKALDHITLLIAQTDLSIKELEGKA